MKSIPMKPTLSTLLMVGLLGVSGQAAAIAPLASAAIDWSSLDVTLFDLDPMDGITPSYGFSNEQYVIWAEGGATVVFDDTTLTITTFAPGWASIDRYLDFTLTPKTLAVFSVSGSVTTTGADYYAGIGLEAWGPGAYGSGYQESGREIFSLAKDLPYSESGKLTATFLNLTGIPLNGGISAYASVSAPVPEPETYAMMLAGLGLLGWMVRRRKA